jgi:hypothetical protein
MSYLLQDLIRVREHREEQASQAVIRARRTLREAKDAATRAEKELNDYAAWRVQEERRKLDSLMRRPLKLGEISDVRQEIGMLREREFEFVDRLTQAQAAVAQAETQLEAARQKHALATRELEKLLEHRRLWQRERDLEDERAADLEAEDFSGPRPSLFSAPGGDFERFENDLNGPGSTRGPRVVFGGSPNTDRSMARPPAELLRIGRVGRAAQLSTRAACAPRTEKPQD